MITRRVLIATPLYPPDAGGPATYTALLEEYLPGEGVDVCVASFSQVRALPKVMRHLAYFFLLMRKGIGVHVVLALDPVSVGLPALWYARLTGKRFVVKVVGDYAWEQGTQRFGIADTLDVFVLRKNLPFPVAFLRVIQRHVARSASLVIVPSKYLQKIVETWSIGSTPVAVIHNAVTVHTNATALSVSLPSHPYVVTVGRLVPWKQFDKVIDAVAHARTHVPELGLVMVGDGPEHERLNVHAKEALQDGFVFTGALTHEETLLCMQSADIFVLYSTYEGLSHVLVEALMLKLPVIVSDIEANTDVLGDGGVAVAVQDTQALAGALVRVHADVHLSGRLRAQAGERAKDYSIDAMITETAHALKNL